MKKSLASLTLFCGAALALLAIPMQASATAIGTTEIFSTSTNGGAANVPNNVGSITLTQLSTTSVLVYLNLNNGIGLINTGGPHTPFAFNLNVADTNLSIAWTTPTGGTAAAGKTFSLDKAGGSATPFGTFTTALDYSGGNGSSSGYFGTGGTGGDLQFTLTLASGLDLTNFVANSSGAYFGGDVSDGTNTGSDAWKVFATNPPSTNVPEPVTISLFGAGLAGAVGMRRRKKKVA